MRYPILLAAVACAIPAVASAQSTAAEQRMRDAERRLQTYEQTTRVDQVQRQVDQLDERIRTAENLRVLEDQRARIPLATAPLVQPAAPATPADLAEAERRRAASLEASEARLKALSDQQRR